MSAQAVAFEQLSLLLPSVYNVGEAECWPLASRAFL